MLGERSEQRGLWEADRLYIEHVGRGSFYGLLASMRGQLFEDEDFAELYCADNGRDSVPPSLLATDCCYLPAPFSKWKTLRSQYCHKGSAA